MVLDKCAGWDSAELVQTGRIEGTDERHGAHREGERSRVDRVQLTGTLTLQNGGKT